MKHPWFAHNPDARRVQTNAYFKAFHHCDFHGKTPAVYMATTELDGTTYQCMTPGCCSCGGVRPRGSEPYPFWNETGQQLSLLADDRERGGLAASGHTGQADA